MRAALMLTILATLLVACETLYSPSIREISVVDDPNWPKENSVTPQAPAQKKSPPAKPDIVPGLVTSDYKILPFSRYNKQQVTQLQLALKRRGYMRGSADGIYGPATQAAMLDFRRNHRLTVVGEPSAAELAILLRK